MLEVMCDPVNHAHLMLKSSEVVEVGELCDVRHIRLRHTQSHLAIMRDQCIGAEAAVAGEIKHV